MNNKVVKLIFHVVGVMLLGIMLTSCSSSMNTKVDDQVVTIGYFEHGEFGTQFTQLRKLKRIAEKSDINVELINYADQMSYSSYMQKRATSIMLAEESPDLLYGTYMDVDPLATQGMIASVSEVDRYDELFPFLQYEHYLPVSVLLEPMRVHKSFADRTTELISSDDLLKFQIEMNTQFPKTLEYFQGTDLGYLIINKYELYNSDDQVFELVEPAVSFFREMERVVDESEYVLPRGTDAERHAAIRYSVEKKMSL